MTIIAYVERKTSDFRVAPREEFYITSLNAQRHRQYSTRLHNFERLHNFHRHAFKYVALNLSYSVGIIKLI